MQRLMVAGAGCKLALAIASGDLPDMILSTGISDTDILEGMKKDHNIMLAGSFGELEHKVIRIGHMGVGCNDEDMLAVLRGLTDVLDRLGFQRKGDMVKTYQYNM